MWTDVDAVRDELAAGGAPRLGAALRVADPDQQRVWLALDPRQRREILAASRELRWRIRDLVYAWVREERLTDVLVVCDDLLGYADLPTDTYNFALYAVLSANNGLPMVPERTRAYLDACLPHAPKHPSIYHNAVCALVELGDHDGAVAQATLATWHGFDAARIRDDELVEPMLDDPRWQAVFAHLEPRAHNDLTAALAEPDRVRALHLTHPTALPKKITGLVNLEVLRIRFGRLRSHRSPLRVLPAWLATLPKLRKLSLRLNQHLAEIPAEILAMPSLRYLEVGDCPLLGGRYRPERINPMLREFARTNPDHRTRLSHVALLTGADEPDGGDPATGYATAELVTALNSAVAGVRRGALRAIGTRVDPATVQLDAGDEVLVVGRMDADRAVLAERLARLEVSLGRRGPRFVVVGESPGPTAPALAAAGVPVILERHLRAVLDAAAPPHLVTAAGSDGGRTAARLRELLRSRLTDGELALADGGHRHLPAAMRGLTRLRRLDLSAIDDEDGARTLAERLRERGVTVER